MANQANHKVDGVAPTVSSIAVTSDAGTDQTYAIGDHIELTATFSENVTVTSDGSATGTPYIPILVGTTTRRAFYNRGSGSTTIVFRYTVAAHATNVDTDGITVAANTLTANTTAPSRTRPATPRRSPTRRWPRARTTRWTACCRRCRAPPASSARRCGSCSARR